ncbi:unnamed protein product [Prunus armeniaca]|uniref:Uncharacterized protein n=1 Tax=Prunus armeniaca TaxID=36596 RepID=A0A6J5U897_PRUAR|nr:unnamed protein product [Prunus armeniaca]
MIAGKRCFMNGDLSEEKEERQWQKAMGEFIAGFVSVGEMLFLGLVWLDWGTAEGHERELPKNWTVFLLNGWRSTAKRTKGEDQDFMDVMLSAIDGAYIAGFDADTVIKATCLREFREDDEEGTRFQKAMALVKPGKITTDPRVWDDPMEFQAREDFSLP